MRPRFVTRTHYQVDEPAYLELLVKECTSAVQSAYDETVADRLAKAIKRRRKSFNAAAGGYALDLARALGVLNDHNSWTDKGHLINLVAVVGSETIEDELELTDSERMLHFRLFLEGDGAALLFVARKLIERGSLPNGGDGWNTLATELFIDTLSSYLKIAGTTADRVALRTELDRIKGHRYQGKTGSHKMFVHLQTLYRLGLVGRGVTGNGRSYVLANDDQRASLTSLLSAVPDLYSLEQLVADNDWAEVAKSVFRFQTATSPISADTIIPLLAPFYRAVITTGVAQCHLSTLIGALQIQAMTTQGEVVSYGVAVDALQAAQRQRPTDIRFHVDRRGRPTFIKLSDAVLSADPPHHDAM